MVSTWCIEVFLPEVVNQESGGLEVALEGRQVERRELVGAGSVQLRPLLDEQTQRPRFLKQSLMSRTSIGLYSLRLPGFQPSISTLLNGYSLNTSSHFLYHLNS